MIRLIIVAITVIGFLILSIPILFIEWIIGKFSPRTKEISSLRIIQGVFKFILWEAGTKVTIIGEENVPKDTPVLYIGIFTAGSQRKCTDCNQHQTGNFFPSLLHLCSPHYTVPCFLLGRSSLFV